MSDNAHPNPVCPKCGNPLTPDHHDGGSIVGWVCLVCNPEYKMRPGESLYINIKNGKQV